MRIISESVRQTLDIGRAIARNLKKGDIVCLSGQLGSGKTVLAKGIAWGLGINPKDVSSPTFILIRQYHQGSLPLYHFDFYRLKSPQDVLGLGYEEYFYADGVSVIEWPDKLKYLLPEESLDIKLSIKGLRKRLIEFKAGNALQEELLKKIYENIRH